MSQFRKLLADQPLLPIFLLCCLLVIYSLVFFTASDDPRFAWPQGEPLDCSQRPNPAVPTVTLYKGQLVNTHSQWGTGVWSGWGSNNNRLPFTKSTDIHKTCDVECNFSHDQSTLAHADAVILETVGHIKHYGPIANQLPFPFPPLRKHQLRGMFYYEGDGTYPQYTTLNPQMRKHFDFVISPNVAVADIPISIMCPWGRGIDAFFQKPNYGIKANFMCSMSTTVDPQYAYIHDQLMALGHVDSFSYNRNALPYWQGNDVDAKIQCMSEYKFVLITQEIVEDYWLQSDFSYALLAGSVPVVVAGPKRMKDIAPSPTSYIGNHPLQINVFYPLPTHRHLRPDARDFETPTHLFKHLRSVARNDDLYRSYFEWKKGGTLESLSSGFQEAVRSCVHFAECRVCKYVRKHMHCHLEETPRQQ